MQTVIFSPQRTNGKHLPWKRIQKRSYPGCRRHRVAVCCAILRIGHYSPRLQVEWGDDTAKGMQASSHLKISVRRNLLHIAFILGRFGRQKKGHWF